MCALSYACVCLFVETIYIAAIAANFASGVHHFSPNGLEKNFFLNFVSIYVKCLGYGYGRLAYAKADQMCAQKRRR